MHVPGQKAYIDWAGDVAWLTDRVMGRRAKVYVMVICLPRSGWVWAGGYADMSMRRWLDGHMRAFEAIGGVPHVLVPDNCATATDRVGAGVTKINDTYRRFAEHYGCGILPARVRRPRDKSLAEGTVNIVEQWAIAPSRELCFRDLAEFNDYLGDRVDWPNAREMPDHGASRDERLLEELPHLLPLPPLRYEICDWYRPKVAPDYHVRVDYIHYSVPFSPWAARWTSASRTAPCGSWRAARSSPSTPGSGAGGASTPPTSRTCHPSTATPGTLGRASASSRGPTGSAPLPASA